MLSPPQTREDVVADTQRLLQAAGRQLVSADERMREASFAIDALATLAEDAEKYGFYDLMRLEPRMQQALLTPALAARASRVSGAARFPERPAGAGRVRQHRSCNRWRTGRRRPQRCASRWAGAACC